MNTSPALIGNDIVDRAEPGVAGKETDRRFLERVFTARERTRILDSLDPTLTLWSVWAAKEAAFKIVTKLRPGLVFAHAAFEVDLGGFADASAQGTVTFEDIGMDARWENGAGYVHCVATRVSESADPTRTIVEVSEDALEDCVLTAEEIESVHSEGSARARKLAKRILAADWGLGAALVLRQRLATGWGPPIVAVDGAPLAGFDISLSHDGRFVAAAVLGPELTR